MSYDAWMRVQDECEGRMVGQVDIKGKGLIDVVQSYGLL
jgi:hypothetical protein